MILESFPTDFPKTLIYQNLFEGFFQGNNTIIVGENFDFHNYKIRNFDLVKEEHQISNETKINKYYQAPSEINNSYNKTYINVNILDYWNFSLDHLNYVYYYESKSFENDFWTWSRKYLRLFCMSICAMNWFLSLIFFKIKYLGVRFLWRTLKIFCILLNLVFCIFYYLKIPINQKENEFIEIINIYYSLKDLKYFFIFYRLCPIVSGLVIIGNIIFFKEPQRQEENRANNGNVRNAQVNHNRNANAEQRHRNDNEIPLRDIERLDLSVSRLLESEYNEILKKQERECVICLEEFNIGEKISFMGCTHFFHTQCLKDWLRRDNFCPICRYREN